MESAQHQTIWVKRSDVQVGDTVMNARTADHTLYTLASRGIMKNCLVTKVTGHGFIWDGLSERAVAFDVRTSFAMYEEFLVQRPLHPAQTKISEYREVLEKVKQCEQKNHCPATLIETFDGITATECYDRYVANMREDARHKMTSKQLAVARGTWQGLLQCMTRAQDRVDQSRAVSVVVDGDVDD